MRRVQFGLRLLPVMEGLRVHTRRADIQGLRAFAVVMVVIHHAGMPLPAGFAGVDVFFVISGFVITGQIERLLATSGFSFVTFYARRIRRLLPALAVMLVVVLVLAFLFQSPLGPQAATGGTALAAALMYGNVHILQMTGDYFAADAQSNPLLHVWSLGVEEQFYLIFPLILVVTWRLGCRGVRSRMTVLALLTATSFALSGWLSYGDFRWHDQPAGLIAFYSSPTRVWEFGVGAMLAVWAANRSVWETTAATRRVSARPMTMTILGVTGVVMLVVLNLTADDTTTWPGIAVLVPVTATLMLILAGTLGTGPVQRLLASAPFQVVGDLSYSIYLWHWPMIVLSALIWPDDRVAWLAALASLGPAWLSYHYVERPLRNGEMALHRVYLGGAVTAGVVVVGSVLLQVAGPLAMTSVSAFAEQREEPTYGRENNCLVALRLFVADDIAKCTVSVPDARGWIMLAGDSHADALSSGLIEANRQLGYSTLALTGASCLFKRDAPDSSKMSNCPTLSSTLLDLAVGENPPKLVVISQAAMYSYGSDGGRADLMRPTLQELTNTGIPVLYSLDVPTWDKVQTSRMTSCNGGFVNFSCGKSQKDILAYQGRSRQAEQNLAHSVPGVAVFDPWATFCDGTSCSALLDGRLAYYDYSHLNRIGSLALAGPLSKAVDAILRSD
jgi:peptidoglycan/LPS O-acetylase OafA/YrhL